MSLINFCALGGVGETGKNLYCVEVDKEYFIFDAGTKWPNQEYYGVDIVLPDILFLVNNGSRIRGIFLSHAHDDHIGALTHILKYVSLDIYAIHFTILVLKEMLAENEVAYDETKLHEVEYNQDINFYPNKIRFIPASHAIPGSSFIALKTKDGVILYTGNYNLEQNSDSNYYTDLVELSRLKEERVLMLLHESISTTSQINRDLNNTFLFNLNKEISKAKGRIIVSLYSTNLKRIAQVIDLAIKNGKKICIIGKKTQRIINIALKENLFEDYSRHMVNLKYLSEENDNKIKNLLCLVCGEHHEPYFMLQRMARGVDRLINIDKDDSIIVLTKPHIGIEKMEARTLDLLYKKCDNVYQMKSYLLMSSSSSQEEAQLLINMLKPTYLIPVVGEYRHQYHLKEIGANLGMDLNNIIIPEIGDFHRFYDGVYMGIKEHIDFNDILIEGKGSNDISDQVLKDRLILAEAGIVMIILNINARKREIISNIQIVSKGFYLDNNLTPEIIKSTQEVVGEAFKGKFINWNDLKNEVKENVARFIQAKTRSKPLVIPVLISTEI